MKNGSDERVDGGEAWEIAWGELRGKERYESDEAEGKPWEIVRKSSVGKERDGSDDKVDGWETVGNSQEILAKLSVCKAMEVSFLCRFATLACGKLEGRCVDEDCLQILQAAGSRPTLRCSRASQPDQN